MMVGKINATALKPVGPKHSFASAVLLELA
jgi:hypothetical protein